MPSLSLAGPEITLLAASEKRIFEKYGLKSDFQFVEEKWIVNLLRERREIVGILPATLAAELVVRDKNLAIFATLFKGWDYYLWASPAIEDFQARVPIPVVVSKGFGMDRLAAYKALSKFNISAKDIKFKPTPEIMGMIAVAQEVKGAVILPVPWKSIAEEMGLKKVYDLSVWGKNIPHTVMLTTRNYLEYSPAKLKDVNST
jgi:ABC-type nitrate/sulfonate/bicarbonate transport system substrate-binding protein